MFVRPMTIAPLAQQSVRSASDLVQFVEEIVVPSGYLRESEDEQDRLAPFDAINSFNMDGAARALEWVRMDEDLSMAQYLVATPADKEFIYIP